MAKTKKTETMEEMPDKENPPKAKEQKDSGGAIKLAALGLLVIAVLALSYYFLMQSGNSFSPGSEVDAETFKGIFEKSTDVFIVMDVRGVSDQMTKNNILQCGVDFSASSGMGGKTVTPLSFGDSGCVAPTGDTPAKDCFEMLKSGITIYVKEGAPGARYYNNGMIVTVGKEYAVGGCGIKKVTQ